MLFAPSTISTWAPLRCLQLAAKFADDTTRFQISSKLDVSASLTPPQGQLATQLVFAN